MAKYEVEFSGDFDEVLSYLVDGILSGSLSATLEDSSDFFGADSRRPTRVNAENLKYDGPGSALHHRAKQWMIFSRIKTC